MGNTTIQTQSFRAVDAGQSKSKRYIIPFTLLCSLFFLWAVANNLNDILLPQFQQAFTLTNFQAGLIQSAFYFGYFVIPIPAGILMKKLSYKAGIITGLFLYAFGAALFWPAAEIMNYTLFLIGLFIIAAGLGCLETAANPFVTVLGPESGGHFRLNLAQTFNSFGAIIAVVFGQSLILSNVPHQSQEALDKMTPDQLSAYKHSLVLSVQTPYMIIVAIVLVVALLIMLTKFPALQSDDHSDAKQSSFLSSLSRLIRIRHWRWAVLAQFCYVGAQTACWSYLIRYAIEEIPGMTPGFAANYLTGTMVCFFIGRFTGTWLISRFAPHKVLAAYALFAMLLCLISAFSGGHIGLLALTLCSAFMSIQYPTIFSLGIKNLGQDTKYGSSFIVMTIIGGGIVTPVMGFVSDAAGKIPTAELVPALCFAVIFIFARFRSQAATN
ncbi:L-fucose:H+ symporter permease [Salmonella enterica]|uniref:L-fucose:H+ symporter permease n=1 Tax=Salmonella enterica subsp. VII serovar 40:z4,z24:[z39] TaxID=1967625 RepID=A0A731XZE6_SALEE|nr:L-fucose:H+ symporter permease [Salmonella enterica]EDO5295224.1 L-fucose:H+ symporter permease [Salmonella enterica subsp. houtenae serovar 40:z4,z24:-]EDS6439369.1 L-fucose:H+ symporter permease [Salmonella enterica subsp. VII str. CFSAN000550]EDU7900394.1 L-fucose:H+ symporter permease [Salmonella enterica subsp. houtenae]QJY67710.1 L-fucose:H+ symporter permease [Salmonella enterica subsp. VII serovar 1,40:g,z51:--]QUZ24357.1 L-fucose:H+ symporter permease [Salmonella enterica subsp. VI